MGVKKQHRLVLFFVCLILIGVTVYPHIPALVKTAQAIQGELKFGSTIDQVITVINRTYYSADVFFGNAAGGRVGVLKGTGNVGIGNITPNHRLSIEDTMAITAATGAQYLLMGNQDAGGAGNPAIIRATNGNLEFGKGTAWIGPGGTFTSNVFFGNTGNVGIGSTAPTKKLDVVGDINFSGSLYQGGVAFTGSKWTNTTGGIYYNSGNVGVGTTAPAATLDIYGNILLSSPTSTITHKYRNVQNGGLVSGSTYYVKLYDSTSVTSKTLKFKLTSRYNSENAADVEVFIPAYPNYQDANINGAQVTTRAGGITGQDGTFKNIHIVGTFTSSSNIQVWLEFLANDVNRIIDMVEQPGSEAITWTGLTTSAPANIQKTIAFVRGGKNENGITSTNTGNVGIGTTNPQKKLDIVAANSTINNTSGNLSIVPNANLLITQGNVGINSAGSAAKLEVYAGVLGGTTGNTLEMGRFTSTNNNGSILRVYNKRLATGTSWDTASTLIQQRIDVTDQGYMEFNPLGGSYGIGFGRGSTEYMRILDGGNVGIGKTNPLAKLDVYGELRISNTNGVGGDYDNYPVRILSYYSGDSMKILANSGREIFGTYGYDKTALGLSGSVGIGTTAPASKFNVTGLTTLSRDGSLQCCGNDATLALGEGTSGTGKRASISFHNGGVAEGTLELFNGSPRRLKIFDNQSQGMGLQMSGPLYVDGTGNSYISGNVGIGTTAPGAKLEVKYGVSGSLTLPLVINPGYYLPGTSSGIGFLTDGNTTYTKGALVYSSNGTGWNIGDFQFLLRNDGTSTPVSLADAKMTIKADGNVGIGTTAPAKKLEVIGSVQTSCPAGQTAIGGSCIDTVARTAAAGTTAVNTCFAENKRLCSFGEYMYACQNSLVTASGGYEHTTDLAALYWGTTYYYNVDYLANMTCPSGWNVSWDYVSAVRPYRCCSTRNLGGQ